MAGSGFLPSEVAADSVGAAEVVCFGHLSLEAVHSAEMIPEASAEMAGCSAGSVLVASIDPSRGFAVGASVAVEASVAMEKSVAAMEFAEVETSPAGEASVAVEGPAGVEASVGAYVAVSAPGALVDSDAVSPHSIPGIPIDPASIVGPVHLHLCAWICFHTSRDWRHR